MTKELIQLIKLIQTQVVSILLVNGYVELIDKQGKYLFNNIRITTSGKTTIKETNLVTDSEVQTYMNLWPKGYRSNLKAVKAKMERFMLNNKCTLKQIMLAAETYIRDKGTPYHGKADYFFYKEENGVETSRCEEYLEDGNFEEEIDYRRQVT